MDDKTRSDIATFLTGVLLGAFALALALSGGLGATALTLVLVILVALYILTKVLPAPNVALLIGVVVGIVLVIVAPQFSPGQLSAEQILLVLGVWLYLR